jgi:pimeloyl-ACP methyl ester carboxylesterase
MVLNSQRKEKNGMQVPPGSTSTRRRFLQQMGAAAATTALVSGAQALSPLTAAAATRKGAASIARFAPSGTPSGTNVVLVHGAWADGSSWSRVIPLLLAAGHYVVAVQIPLTHLSDSVNATIEVLQQTQLQGPTVLAGHSYGGAVITNAGTGQPHVVGLVYASAYAPAQGEVLGQFPTGPGTSHIYPDNDGFLWIDQQWFQWSFAQDVDSLQASIMACVQKPISANTFGDPSGPPAWQKLASWYLISENDRMLPPATQQMFASRMKATTISVPSSHASIVSYPKQVFEMIQAAAKVGAQTKR